MGRGVQMADWLAARSTDTATALIYKDGRLTYQELHEMASGFAGYLREQGVDSGQRVAVLARSALLFAVILNAMRYLQAILVPINTRLAAPEIAWQLRDAEVSLLLCDAVHEGLARNALGHLAALQSSEPDASSAPALACLDARAPLPHGRTVVPERVDLSAVQSLMYTSGTTGTPKGALITYGNHYFGAAASAFGLGIDRRDVWMTPLPLFHVGGQSVLMRSLLYGTTALIQERFDAPQAVQLIDRERVTLLSVVAVTLSDLLQALGERRFPAHVRCVLLGGGPAPKPLLEACARVGCAVSQSYGLTESNSQAVTLLPHEALAKLGSAGRPLLGTEVRILKISDEAQMAEPMQALAGEAGEIVVRGPQVVNGYWKREEATAATFIGGWLHTGDIGVQDADGYLYVLDRRQDLIVSGGENVYPAEVESVLLAHPAIREAGVTALADDRFGHRPAAIVRLHEGATADADLLREHCRERLAAYKVPVRIEFSPDPLPRNAAGKLLRRELCAWLSER